MSKGELKTRLKDTLVAAGGVALIAFAVWRVALWAEGPVWFRGLGLAIAIAAAWFYSTSFLYAIFGRRRMREWAQRHRSGAKP